jgi:hypothetical protein
MRPPRSSCGRGRLVGRNRPAAATRWWRAWERFVAADAVVIKLRAGYPSLHPLMPKRPVRVLVPVAHGQFAVTPSTTWAVALRHVRLVRVGRISAGNPSRKNNRRGTTQYRSAVASKPECHPTPLKHLPRGRAGCHRRQCGRGPEVGGASHDSSSSSSNIGMARVVFDW